MSTEIVIDLGRDRSGAGEGSAPIDPRRLWVRRRRRWGSVLCAVLVLVALTAAVSPPSPGLTLVAAPGPTVESFSVSGDYLILRTGDGTSSVHRLPTGDHLWTGRGNLYGGDLYGVDLYGVDVPDRLYSTACPDVGACERPETVVWDAATGADLWSSDEWIEPVGDRFMTRPHLFLPAGQSVGPTRVMAPRTGETLLVLAGWTVVGTGADGTAVLTAPTGAGTAVALLDPDGAAPRYLGTVAGEFEGCAPFDGGMVCDGDAGITLWAFAAGRR